jgi:hypothetical protein
MEARWWAMRPAQSHKPASYVCPFCDGMLHATSEHALIAPEGDVSKRRHAHMDCVVAARKRGELTTEDEWRAEQRRTEKAKRPPEGGRFGAVRKRGRS